MSTVISPRDILVEMPACMKEVMVADTIRLEG